MTPLPSSSHDLFAGQYRLDRELGGGGMSRVFLAHDVALDRDVVVKVVASALAEDVSGERFAREVRVAARLQQANIVPVLSAGVADGVPYYTMPYVRGESLRARIATKTPLPLGEAVGILRDVARALAYAHAEGVVHRDIKPDNILLSGGAAVVTDFGIAKALSASRTATDGARATLTGVGRSIGTPAYMAPEQASGDPGTDHRADVYALGIVAWELLAGAHPFGDRTTAHALIAAHISEPPPSLAARRPDLPLAIARLVMRCLAKDPAQRPASAAAVLQELEAVTTPTASGATTMSVRSPKPRRRVASGIAVGVVAFAVAMGAWRWRARATPAVTTAERSVAVLPFSAVGGDTANTYFAEGIADELTTALARVPGLRLAGRASAARVKARGASAQEIGTALGVGAVLDGSVRRAGDRIRVSAELTSATDGRLLWKESYERELKDVFAVQDELAEAIANALQVRLGAAAASDTPERGGTTNVAAYDLYLRGLSLYRRRGTVDIRDAESNLERAIALDSSFARAHALLAVVLLVEPYYLPRSMHEVMPRARAAAERALAIDSLLPEAHLAAGYAHTEAFEWRDGEAELRRALALDPRNAEAMFRLGFLILMQGRARDAVAPLEQARALDPLYAISAAYLGWALAMSGRRDDGFAEGQRAFDLDPNSESVGTIYTNTMIESGRLDAAIAQARRRVPLTTNIRRLSFYAAPLALAGDRSAVIAMQRRALALPATMPGRTSALVYIDLALGDTASALTAMEHAAATDGDMILSHAIAGRYYDAVRGSPRFAAVLRRFDLDVARLTLPDGGRSR